MKQVDRMLLTTFILLCLNPFSSLVHSQSTTDSCSNNINLNDIINFDTTAMTCEVVWNPHGYILRHAQAATDVWSFLLSAPYRNNWIGMGFSKNGLMIGSSAMVGWVNPNGTGTGLQYLLKDQDPNKVVPNQGELKLVENTTTVIRQGNLVYLAFQLNAPQPLIEVLYAVGPNGKLPNDKNGLKLTQHQDRVSTTLNYATGKSQTQSSPYAGLRKTHGALNMLGWGILMPIGAIVARYFKEWDPIWYYSHAAIQGLGWLFGLVGFILGFVTQGFIHAQVEHHKNLGITILVVGCLQVTALLLRPQKGSKFRKYWNWYHHNAGRILVILAISNIFYGIHLGMEGPSWYGTYAVILVILVIAAIAMEIRSWRQR